MKNVLILGGGFGGLTAVSFFRKHIKSGKVSVTLIDRNNYSLFTPMLAEVVSGNVKPENIVFPLREICVKNLVHFVKDEVKKVDPETRKVICENGEYSYDYLIVATGSRTNFRGNLSAMKNAFEFKNITDAIHIKYLVIDSLEKASTMDDPEEKRKLLSFSIIGGGITGVELASEMNDYIRAKIKKEYNTVKPDEYDITIFEYAKTVLPAIDPGQAQKAQEILVNNGIHVVNGAAVDEVGLTHITYSINGQQYTKNSTLTVWTAGVEGQEYLKHMGGEATPDSRLKINKALTPQTIDAPNVFVIGDSCAYEFKGRFLPPVAPLAMQQGVMAVKNIIRLINGKEPIEFSYLHFGYLVSLGKNNSVVNLFGIKMRGALAYYIWKVAYLAKIGMFKKQVAVFFDWVMSFCFGNESVLILEQDNCTNCILQKNHKKPVKRMPEG